MSYNNVDVNVKKVIKIKAYKIGDVATITGLTTRTIRYYEELGLTGNIQRANGEVRLFDDTDVKRLQKITTLKNLGLSLEEIGQVIDLYFTDGRAIEGKRKVLEILQSHLIVTEGKIRELDSFRTELLSKIALMQLLIQQYE